MSEIHQSFGAASREVGGRSTGRDGTVDRREVKIVTTGKSAIGSASATARTGSDRLKQRIRECDALRAAATPVLHQEKPDWCSEGCPSLDNIPPVPDNVQDVEGWLSCRNCESRNALEFGDQGTIAFWANWWRKELPSWQFSQRMSPCQESADHVCYLH